MQELVQGDTFHKRILLKYPNGDPIDLTDVIAFSHIRKQPGDELIAKAETVVDPENGTVDVIFDGEKTTAIEPGTYGYDIRIKSAENLYTVAKETIRVIRPYTEVENG